MFLSSLYAGPCELVLNAQKQHNQVMVSSVPAILGKVYFILFSAHFVLISSSDKKNLKRIFIPYDVLIM